VAKKKKTAMGKRLEKAAVITGRELGALVGRVEKEARAAVRKGNKMQGSARNRSVELMRRAAQSLEELAAQLEKAGS
jgi:hypothetical protein